MEDRRYAILGRDAANRVYGMSALELLRAEIDYLERAVFGEPGAEGTVELGGLPYVVVRRAGRPLTPVEIQVLSNASTAYAMFEMRDGALVPVVVQPRVVCDDDIVTIQRYTGKTNEQFTRLLVNVTLASVPQGFTRLLGDEPLRFLDPLCGRGTSLNQAVVYGMDACGIEVDKKDVDAYERFVSTWMKNKRIKHHIEHSTLKRGRSMAAHRFSVTYQPPRGGSRRIVEVVADDTVNASQDFPAKSFDLLVCDLPYGVQHGARGSSGRLSRSPEALLEEALPAWREVMRNGAALGIAWNLRTLPRERVEELVAAAQLECSDVVDETAFVHRVDQAITRDLLVATRKAS